MSTRQKNLLVLPTILLLFSCQQTRQRNSSEIVSLDGFIRNAGPAEIKIGDRTTPINEQGQFNVEFDLQEAGYFTLEFGERIILFLTPGDFLTLDTDTADLLENLSFSGRGAEVNNFLVEQALRDREHSQSIAPIVNQIFSLDEDAFISKLEVFNSKFLNPLKEFLDKNRAIDPQFAKYEKAKLLYSWAEGRLVYPQIHRDVTGDNSYIPSEEYFDFLMDLDFENPDLLNVDEYQSFLSSFLDKKKGEIAKENPDILSLDNQMSQLQNRAVLATFGAQEMRNYFLANMMREQIENFGIHAIEELMDGFEDNCKDGNLLSDIDRLYTAEVLLREEAEIKIYKTIGNIALEAHLFFPADLKQGDMKPAIVFFHGGGWNIGKAEWAYGRCRYFSSRGMVAVSAQYRLRDRHGVIPVQSVADAKSVIRWMRQNSAEFHLDPDRIAASGWSSGGHIAACAGIIKGFDDISEDLSVSSVPDALVFWFPAVNIEGDGWFKSILEGQQDESSLNPTEHIRTGNPPTIIFQGTADSTVPFSGVKEFTDKMVKASNRCDLHAYEGREHLFHYNPDDFVDTMVKADRFLVSLAFLEGEPDVTALRK